MLKDSELPNDNYDLDPRMSLPFLVGLGETERNIVAKKLSQKLGTPFVLTEDGVVQQVVPTLKNAALCFLFAETIEQAIREIFSQIDTLQSASLLYDPDEKLPPLMQVSQDLMQITHQKCLFVIGESVPNEESEI